MKPILFSLHNFDVYSYPLLIGVAWGVGYNISINLLNKFTSSKVRDFKRILTGVFISSWMGAKVFFLLLSEVSNQKSYLTSSNFWLGGGFVFYGGLIFSMLFLVLYQYFKKENIMKDCYLLLPGLCFGHAIGRIGCFLAGCCFGHKIEHLKFWDNMNVTKHPVQIYESIFLVILGIFLLKAINNKKYLLVFSYYIIPYSIFRFFIEFLRGDEIRGIYFFNISSSQIISVCLIFLFFILKIFKKLI